MNAELWRQLCEEEEKRRGSAGWDQRIEKCDAALTQREDAADSVAKAGKPLNAHVECL